MGDKYVFIPGGRIPEYWFGQPPVDGLALWVVYDHSKNWDNRYMARQWLLNRPTGNYLLSHSLEELRNTFREAGLVSIPPSETDDPIILETWI